MEPEGSLPQSQGPATCLLGHIDPVHTSLSHFLKTHFNIILTSTPKPYKCSLFTELSH
jgi:hypothetical protein